jgi:hypothetical protein
MNTSSFLRLGASVFLCTSCIILGLPTSQAQDVAATAKVFIQQQSPNEYLGSVILIKPDQSSKEKNDQSFIIDSLYPGLHSVLVSPPKGMSTVITVYRNDEVIKTAPVPQLAFQVEANDELRIEIKYTLSYFGTVGVTSSPGGVQFELSGPNNFVMKSKTPITLEKMPIGAYSVRFLPDGCVLPPPKSDVLKHLGRVSFSITFNCPTLQTSPSLNGSILDAPVAPVPTPAVVESVVSEPTPVQKVDASDTPLFRDVPNDAWFANDVRTMNDKGLLTGYRDAAGKLTGEFGPQRNVNLAELAAIAHRVSGLPEPKKDLVPVNVDARNQWFSSYIASAEAKHWWLYDAADADLTRSATRGEVLVTLLQALDIPIQWAQGNVFEDVALDTDYAAAIETSAKLGFVSGSGGGSKPAFRPASFINRAELSKILVKILASR